MKYLLGEKLGMTQTYDEQGKVVPVTVIKAMPVIITQIRTIEKDGYSAVQVGTGERNKINKPLAGHLKEAGKFKKIKEFRNGAEVDSVVGNKFDVSVFSIGDKVKISGLTKGRGFQGAVKRYGFHGMPASHGHHHVLRHVGSIGQRFPQHTLKGMRMAGRMGGERVSVRGLKVISVDQANNLLAVRGAVPGRKGTWLEIIAL